MSKEKCITPKEFHNRKIRECIEQTETKKTLNQELTSLINRYSRENDSNTPDWILANYMINCLRAGEYLINMREHWNKH